MENVYNLNDINKYKQILKDKYKKNNDEIKEIIDFLHGIKSNIKDLCTYDYVKRCYIPYVISVKLPNDDIRVIIKFSV